jgi:hypothetical protein
MNTLSILAMAMVIYLFGGYLDRADALPTGRNGTARKAAQTTNVPNK